MRIISREEIDEEICDNYVLIKKNKAVDDNDDTIRLILRPMTVTQISVQNYEQKPIIDPKLLSDHRTYEYSFRYRCKDCGKEYTWVEANMQKYPVDEMLKQIKCPVNDMHDVSEKHITMTHQKIKIDPLTSLLNVDIVNKLNEIISHLNNFKNF